MKGQGVGLIGIFAVTLALLGGAVYYTNNQSSQQVPYQAMMYLVTWTPSNGYSTIQWRSITALSIFHVIINSDGSLSYDGSFVNVAQTIATAHANNVKVTLAIGGAGQSPMIISKILSNYTFRATFINNVQNQVKNQGYDGVDIDFEGFYNRNNFTNFMQQFSTIMWQQNPNYQINLPILYWSQQNWNISALEPYVTHFDDMYNPQSSEVIFWTSQLKNYHKFSIGYNLQTGNSTYFLSQQLVANRRAGYGYMFWNAQQGTLPIYNASQVALNTPLG
jgi:hypothetical protein